jgi:hypothetical protein
MAVKKVVTVKYIDDEEGFEFAHQPVDDTLKIIQTEEGFKAGYLVQDDGYRSPDEDGDDGLFLVNYHGDFEVKRDKVITKDDVREYYQSGKKIAGYWAFKLASYIHSGVYLYLQDHRPANVYLQHESWDTSHVGLVLVSRKEWKTEKKALKAAQGLVEEWNQCLSGEVYGVVVETYNKNKEQVDDDSCWGYYGLEHAKEELAFVLTE